MTRHEARQCAIQALYEIDISGSEILDAISFALEEKVVRQQDVTSVQTLVGGTCANRDEIDTVLRETMERWSTDRVGRVELSILRLALYELVHDPSVDEATIVNEAVVLAKDFSTDQSAKFINGVLARVLPKVRGADESGSSTE